MTHVITEPCVGVKDTACTQVCPVDCIYGADKDWLQLYINPIECIDCGLCVDACPVEAIFPEEEVPEKWSHFVSRARKRFELSTSAAGESPEKVQRLEREDRHSQAEELRIIEKAEKERKGAAKAQRKQILKLLLLFETALEAGEEASIQSFLEENQTILLSFARAELMSSKFRLADKFEADFITIGSEPVSWSFKPRITFIEIERASGRLFTKKGDPTSFLTHAIRQVQDWKAWNRQNYDFVAKRLEDLVNSGGSGKRLRYLEQPSGGISLYGFIDVYLIIAGRHRDLSVGDVIRLTQMNEDLAGISIITYDKLIERLIRPSGLFWDGRSWW